MKRTFVYSKIKSSELPQALSVIADAHNLSVSDQEAVLKFLKAYGIENIRVVRMDSKIVGALLIVWWGHWFGGKSIPTAAITFVGVASEVRRLGAASHLMRETVRECFKEKVPISTLYAANVPLYRKAGYEFAIERSLYDIKLEKIQLRNMSLDIVPYEGKGFRKFKSLYDRVAGLTNGNVDRTDIVWEDYIKPRWVPSTKKFLIMNGKEVEGYVNYYVKDKTIQILDHCLATRNAAERLLTFLADHSSMLESVRIAGGFQEPLIHLLPDSGFRVRLREDCLLRISEVKSAFENRGYPKCMSSEIHFDVRDNIIDGNSGLWKLKVKNGVGKVTRGGEGTVKIDIRSLAQLYTGYLSPLELKVVGDIEGPDDVLDEAGMVFAGPRPWIRDDF